MTAILVATSPAAKRMPEVMPHAGACPIGRASSLMHRNAPTADAPSQTATQAYVAPSPSPWLERSETPSSTRPSTDTAAPSRSRLVSATCVMRETMMARIPMPPAAAACTSASGASASATT